jgi:quinol monooxygenase YgiN
MSSRFHAVLIGVALLLGLTQQAGAQEAAAAVTVVTYVEVHADAAGAGATLLERYRAASRKAQGNAGCAVGQELGRPNRFVIIESWRDEAAFTAHEADAETARWRDRLKAIAHNPPDQRVTHPFAGGGGMDHRGALYVVTHVDVTPPRQAETEIALRTMADESRKDAGNVRYEVLQQKPPRTNHFTIVALWASRAAFEAHEHRPHRALFRETMAPMLGALYDERLYKPLE